MFATTYYEGKPSRYQQIQQIYRWYDKISSHTALRWLKNREKEDLVVGGPVVEGESDRKYGRGGDRDREWTQKEWTQRKTTKLLIRLDGLLPRKRAFGCQTIATIHRLVCSPLFSCALSYCLPFHLVPGGFPLWTGLFFFFFFGARAGCPLGWEKVCRHNLQSTVVGA